MGRLLRTAERRGHRSGFQAFSRTRQCACGIRIKGSRTSARHGASANCLRTAPRSGRPGQRMVMTGHLFHAGLDPAFPATLSPSVINGLLRGRLGYDGVVVTDDLQMDAIAAEYTLEEVVLRPSGPERTSCCSAIIWSMIPLSSPRFRPSSSGPSRTEPFPVPGLRRRGGGF